LGNQHLCTICHKLLAKRDWVGGICEKCANPSTEVLLYDSKVILHVKNKEERSLLEGWAKDYNEIEFDVPDPYNDISALLLYRLETYRIGKSLVNVKDEAERKKLHESLNYSTNQIEGIQKKIGITRDKIQKRKGSAEVMFPQLMKEFAKYRAEHQHVFRGMAVCTKCNERIIVKSFLPTFEQWSIKKLEDLAVQHTDSQTLINQYRKHIEAFGNPEQYSEEIRRLIENVTDADNQE